MKRSSGDLAADPFHEQVPCPHRTRVDVLGGRFHIESNSRALLRLVDVAFGALPAHALEKTRPRFRIRLFVSPDMSDSFGVEPPPLRLHSGSGVLCGTVNAANFVVISPEQHTALLVVTQDMLRFPYHLRYELIEFAIYTLASRAQHLISLHAGCIGRNGRGLLLIGASGGGKSTLSLHSLLHGLDLVAEDGLLAAPDTLRATGIGSFLHLREDSLKFVDSRIAARIRKSPVIRRRSGVEKFELDLRRTRYSISPRALQIVGVVVLSRKRVKSGENLLKELSRRELLLQLESNQPYAAGLPGWKEFSKRVLRLGGFELRRGQHPDEGVAALISLLP